MAQQAYIVEHVPEKWYTPKDIVPGVEPIIDPELNTTAANNTNFMWHLTKETVGDISGVCRGILKILCAKRISEGAATRSQIYNIIDQLSVIMIDGLKSSTSRYQNSIVQGLQFVHSLLTDERTTTVLQTIQLISFQKTGGIDLLFEILLDSIERYNTLQQLSEVSEESAKTLKSLKESMELVVDITLTITNHRLLLESPHTANWQSLFRDKLKPDYYDSHLHLIELRLTCLKNLTTLWNYKLLHTLSSRLIVNLVASLTQILKGEGELAGLELTPATNNPLMYMPTLGNSIFGRQQPPVVVADATRVDHLHDMGFPRAAAELALIRCNNNVTLAADYLLTHPASHFPSTRTPTAVNLDIPSAPAVTPVDAVIEPLNTETQTSSATADVAMTEAIADVVQAGDSLNVLMDVDLVANATSIIETKDFEKERSDNLSILNTLRSDFKTSIISRVLYLLDMIENSVLFSIKDLICLVGKDNTLETITESLSLLLDALFSNSVIDDKAISIRLHLIVLIINDSATSLDVTPMLASVVQTLSRLLDVTRNATDYKKYDWMSSVILILECYFLRVDEPAEAPAIFNGESETVPAVKEYLIEPSLIVMVFSNV